MYHSTLDLRVMKKKKKKKKMQKKKCCRGLTAQRRTGKIRNIKDVPSLPGKETRLGVFIVGEAEKLGGNERGSKTTRT